MNYAVKQEALDELGRYNVSRVTRTDACLCSVFNEIGMRTVDDFGVVGASIDQARIAGNKALPWVVSKHGQPNYIEVPSDNLDAVDDITLGLVEPLTSR